MADMGFDDKVETTVTYGGINYHAELMKIERTMLGQEDHGIATAVLTCVGGGFMVGFGGVILDTYDAEQEKRVSTEYGLGYIMEILSVVGVHHWEDLVNQYVYILFNDNKRSGTAVGIADPFGHRILINDDFFAAVLKKDEDEDDVDYDELDYL